MNRAKVATIFCTATLATGSVVEAAAHYVRSGETLMGISRQYGVTLRSLRAANPNITSHLIYVGDIINVPELYKEVLVTTNSTNNTRKRSAQNHQNQKLVTHDKTAGNGTYTVKQGDNLYRIAINHKLTLEQLFAANPAYRDGRVLNVGARLNLPLQPSQNLVYAAGGGTTSTDSTAQHRPKTERRQITPAGNKIRKATAQRGMWRWPVLGSKRISSKYGERFLFGKWEFHDGVDIAAKVGTPVVASRAGKVIESSYSETTGWGRMVIIEHGDGIKSRYAHLDASFVFAGQFVQRGEHIGTIGTTGRTTGPHLHFGIFSDQGSENPLAFF